MTKKKLFNYKGLFKKKKDSMDFESRFQFETNLLAPRQISTIKRRKSFSEKFFKKTGVQLKLAGKNTLRIRQKFAFKERVPVLLAFNGAGISCRSNPATPQEISDVTSQNTTTLQFPHLTMVPTTSMITNCAEKPEESLVNVKDPPSANAVAEWVINGPSLTECKPIVLSSTADSYLPVSSNASFITLPRKGDKSPVLLMKESGDKFDTFRRSKFELNYTSETPSFSSINKNNINKSVVNGSIKFNVSSADNGCSFDNSAYDTFPSLESNSVSVTSPSLNSLKSFDSSYSPLAKSTPVSFDWDGNKLGVSRTNFTCRVTPNNRSNTYANGHRNSCSYESAERDAVDNKLNRHSICDILVKDLPFPNGFNCISNTSTGINSFQQELMTRCSRSLKPSQSKPILSMCSAEKPTIPVKPSLLKSQERYPQGLHKVVLKQVEKEINNNSIFTDYQKILNTGTNLKDSSHRPNIQCKPDIPNCRPHISACKPQISTCRPQISACKPQISACKPRIPNCKPQIPNCKPLIPNCKPQIPTCMPQIPFTQKPDIFLNLTDATTADEVPAKKPKPILKQSLYDKNPLKLRLKIPLDNILKNHLENSTFNNEKSENLNHDSLSLSRPMKVHELVSTFNNALKQPQNKSDADLEAFNNFSGKATHDYDWTICNPNGLPLPLGPLYGDFLRKRSLIEEKLPNMISLVANGSHSLRTQI